MFNGLLISVFESDAGSQVTVIREPERDNDDGPTPARSGQDLRNLIQI